MRFLKISSKTLWKVHSIVGIVVGIPLLLISLTGSILVFRYEIEALYHPQIANLKIPEQGRLSFDELLEKNTPKFPNHLIGGWAMPKSPKMADFVFLMERNDPDKGGLVCVNPYTGEPQTDILDYTGNFTGTMLNLHTTLLAKLTGIIIVGVIGLLLCLLGITGILLYRKFWKSLFKLNLRGSARLLTGNLHKRIGVLSAPFMLCLGFTGAVWSVQHVVGEFSGAHHEHEPITSTEPLWHGSLDGMISEAKEKIPGFRPTYISFPHEPEDSLNIYGHPVDKSPLRSDYCSGATFEREGGKWVKHYDVRTSNFLLQIYDSFRPVHFGDFGGIIIKIIWCVFGLTPALLALSGSFMAYERIRQKRARHAG